MRRSKLKATPILEAEGEFRRIDRWQCELSIPTGGVAFKKAILELYFPDRYPEEAPKCSFKPGFYHPNVYESGLICHSIVGDGWHPRTSVKTIIAVLEELMLCPNLQSPAQHRAAQDLIDDLGAYWTKFCDQD